MKNLTAFVLAFFSLPALAHIGPEAMDRHLFEHLVIVLAIGLPAGFGIFKLWSERRKKGTEIKDQSCLRR